MVIVQTECELFLWAGVKAGKYPRSVKLGPRTTAWRVEEILALIKGLSIGLQQ